jgi:hypothetical protein
MSGGARESRTVCRLRVTQLKNKDLPFSQTSESRLCYNKVLSVSPIFSSRESQLQNKGFSFSEIAYTPHVQLEQLSLGACLDCKKNLENSYSTFVVIWQKLSNHGLTRLKRYIYRQTVQLVIFLHTFNAPYIRLKIR